MYFKYNDEIIKKKGTGKKSEFVTSKSFGIKQATGGQIL